MFKTKLNIYFPKPRSWTVFKTIDSTFSMAVVPNIAIWHQPYSRNGNVSKINQISHRVISDENATSQLRACLLASGYRDATSAVPLI